MQFHWLNLVIILVLSAQNVFAQPKTVTVTPLNQREQDVNFSLSVHEEEGWCTARLEYSSKENIKNLLRLELAIYEGKNIVLLVPLEQHPTTVHQQARTVQFSFANSQLEGGVLNLMVGNGLRDIVSYRLPLIEFVVTERTSRRPILDEFSGLVMKRAGGLAGLDETMTITRRDISLSSRFYGDNPNEVNQRTASLSEQEFLGLIRILESADFMRLVGTYKGGGHDLASEEVMLTLGKTPFVVWNYGENAPPSFKRVTRYLYELKKRKFG